nr:hypothetical protein CKG001_14470 [Bdellovibrio sp. CKG001]
MLSRGRKILFALAAVGVLGAMAFKEMTPKQQGSCLQIFFDPEGEAQVQSGRAFAVALQRLLSPYEGVLIHKAPIDLYQRGMIGLCDKNIYIGTHFDHRVPRVFVEDFMNARGSVAWFGYNIWQMGPRLETDLGLRFLRSARPDARGFFDEIVYEGGTFKKSRDNRVYEQVELLPADVSKFVTLAESRNSRTRELVPYIVRSKNRFYIADIPEIENSGGHVSLMLAEVMAHFMEEATHSKPKPKFIAATE